MIKKLKIGLMSLAALSLVFVAAGEVKAAAGDLTWSADQTVDLSSPDIDLTIKSGSTAEGLVVNAGTVVVTLVAGETFTITSASADLGFTPLNGGVVTCSSGAVAQLVITAPVSQAYTITPTDSIQCTPSGSGGGGGGGGGSVTSTVAQSSTPVTVQVTPTITMVTNDPGCSGSNKYNTSTGKVCVNNSTLTPGMSLGKVYNFGTATLKNGSQGEAAKELQRFLNQVLNLGLVVDGKIGPKTIAVIKKWQKDNGLVADGLIGAKTKAKMNASIK